MRELGRRGGSTPKMTALRKAATGQDDGLREQARDVLSRALAGEQVDKQRLDAARSLFAFRPAVPPADAAVTDEGRAGKSVGLVDVVRVAVSCGLVEVVAGAIVVDGERVETIDPGVRPPAKNPSASASWILSPPANNSPQPPPEPAAPRPEDVTEAEFDEREKMTRRYGSVTSEQWRWT